MGKIFQRNLALRWSGEIRYNGKKIIDTYEIKLGICNLRMFGVNYWLKVTYNEIKGFRETVI